MEIKSEKTPVISIQKYMAPSVQFEYLPSLCTVKFSETLK